MKRRRGRLPLQKGVAMICDECGTKEALDAAGLLDNSSMRTAIIREVRKRNI